MLTVIAMVLIPVIGVNNGRRVFRHSTVMTIKAKTYNYPKELPVFEIVNTGCEHCRGLHSEGAPTIYGGKRIDIWSCVQYFEPFDLEQLRPLNHTAQAMIEAVKRGVKYPGKFWEIKV